MKVSLAVTECRARSIRLQYSMLFDSSYYLQFSDTGFVRLESRARVYLRKPLDVVFQKSRILTCQYLLLFHLLLPSESEKVINNPSAKQGRGLTLRICAVHHVFLSSLHISSVHSLSALSHDIVSGQNGHSHGRQHQSGQEACRKIVQLGASRVITACRNMENGKAAAKEIQASTSCTSDTPQVSQVPGEIFFFLIVSRVLELLSLPHQFFLLLIREYLDISTYSHTTP